MGGKLSLEEALRSELEDLFDDGFIGDATSLACPVEKGFVGALLDKGGNAAIALIFDSLLFEGDDNEPEVVPLPDMRAVISFLFMPTAAWSFSGVVPKLARVPRDASDRVVSLKSFGGAIDRCFKRL